MPTEQELVAQIMADMNESSTLADGLGVFIQGLLDQINGGATLQNLTDILTKAQENKAKIAAALALGVPGVTPGTV